MVKIQPFLIVIFHNKTLSYSKLYIYQVVQGHQNYVKQLKSTFSSTIDNVFIIGNIVEDPVNAYPKNAINGPSMNSLINAKRMIEKSLGIPKKYNKNWTYLFQYKKLFVELFISKKLKCIL